MTALTLALVLSATPGFNIITPHRTTPAWQPPAAIVVAPVIHQTVTVVVQPQPLPAATGLPIYRWPLRPAIQPIRRPAPVVIHHHHPAPVAPPPPPPPVHTRSSIRR